VINNQKGKEPTDEDEAGVRVLRKVELVASD
jgi:hypothetical protein